MCLCRTATPLERNDFFSEKSGYSPRLLVRDCKGEGPLREKVLHNHDMPIALCKMLGIDKLNTTAYHPQCDGAVEWFNRTLKTALRKHAARFGCQWDQYLPGILWAYRNTPHSSTGEKLSFLLFGLDCRTPTEAAYLPVTEISPTDVSDYREELMSVIIGKN